MIKAVVFDLDGVLVDPLRASARSYQRALMEAGYKRPTVSQIYHTFGLTAYDTIKHFTKETSPSKIKKIVSQTYRYELDGIASLTLRDVRTPKNSVRTVEGLSKSYRLGIVSASRKKRVKLFLSMIKLSKYFKIIVSAEEYSKPKPNPESLLIAARRLKAKPNEVVYIGDRDVDVGAARAAGMKIIGFLEFARHRLPDADFSTKRFGSIPSLIERIDARG